MLKPILALASVGAFLQIPDPSQFKDITLPSAMAIAIVFIWRAYAAKDALLVKTYTDTLNENTKSNADLSAAMRESTEAKNQLVASLQELKISVEKLVK